MARRASGNVSRSFNVDFTPDPIASVRALTEPEGEPIPRGVPQPDATPTFVWSAATSTAPIAGYSHALGVEPDCAADTTATAVSLGPLGEGSTLFGVRAVDQAGNCGPVAAFDVVVSSGGVPIDALGWPGRLLLVAMLGLAPWLARVRSR